MNKSNGNLDKRVVKFVLCVALTMFGIVWLFMDMNREKKSTIEILDKYSYTDEESLSNIQETNNTGKLQNDNNSEDNELDTVIFEPDFKDESIDIKKMQEADYMKKKLPEGIPEEELEPELFDKK